MYDLIPLSPVQRSLVARDVSAEFALYTTEKAERSNAWQQWFVAKELICFHRHFCAVAAIAVRAVRLAAAGWIGLCRRSALDLCAALPATRGSTRGTLRRKSPNPLRSNHPEPQACSPGNRARNRMRRGARSSLTAKASGGYPTSGGQRENAVAGVRLEVGAQSLLKGLVIWVAGLGRD